MAKDRTCLKAVNLALIRIHAFAFVDQMELENQHYVRVDLLVFLYWMLIDNIGIVKVITDELKVIEGEVRRNPKLRMGIYNQHFVDKVRQYP